MVVGFLYEKFPYPSNGDGKKKTKKNNTHFD